MCRHGLTCRWTKASRVCRTDWCQQTRAACGSDDTAEKTDTTPSAEPSETAVEEPDEVAATVNQYASIVAKNEADLREQLTTMGECDWSSAGSLDPEPNGIVCAMGLLTLSYGAQAMSVSLEGAQKPDAPGYVGAVPSEIELLVADTIESSTTLAEAAKAANDDRCALTGDGKCMDLRNQTWLAMDDVEGQLDAWGPYTG